MDFKAEIEHVAIEKIKPYLRNAKKHPAKQIQMLAQQILIHGFDQPICVDADYVIVKGHGRREAAISAGLRTVPVIVRRDLTEEQCRLARIADNRLAEYGEVDEEMLKFEFGTLAAHDVDLTLSGFELGDIEKILAEPEPKAEKEPAAQEASQFIVAIHCVDEPQMQELYGELQRRGLAVKLIT